MTEGRPTISTHVLDLERGVPAAGVEVVLMRLEDGRQFGPVATDSDGRVRDLLDGGDLRPGAYELRFDPGMSRRAGGGEAFFRRIAVTFTIDDTSRSSHVPLLLSSFGLTTYRGS